MLLDNIHTRAPNVYLLDAYFALVFYFKPAFFKVKLR